MRTRSRTTVIAASLVLALGAAPLSAPAFAASGPASAHSTTTGPDTEALEAAIAGLPDQDATAAVVRVGGEGSWHGVAGVRDLRTGAPALENARFRAGSTTKIVTAALVLRLAAEGRISLDGTVQQYLPGLLTEDFAPITVRQLLNFTSGLQPGASFGDSTAEMYPHRFETLTPEEVVAASVAKGPDPDHAPGEHQDYGNIHYTVLAMLVEKVTGDSYAHQAAVRIFRPLGMRHTSFPDGPDPRIHGPHNRGYEWIDGELVDVTDWNMSDRWAAGDMISTTADLERLLRGVFSGRVVPEPQLKEMFAVPAVPGATMGAPFSPFKVNGRTVWAKTGSRPGYHTVVAATRDLSRTVVYSVNSTDARSDGEAIARRFAFPAFNR
ncbi:serine hydrolase domain-containing protein [Streptomyces sp. WI04-05B]|uniref:serine hydrolase domain-containing protein n=1 Tax=Streptomyces TaxID=1883 RepID=UPI0029A2C4FB|nr:MULTISPECIES: serine hydrolase domain-containing protein [unclassified Streptomyces]MDX2541982.1 serine hydrolase [Streptomyces sp. WI04-05B]MDX2587064.1 serine hydrolase [Streptomyces sp. WI04-05A]MDX3750012.1 serine hydrolase [Streptomyces sp. AK08-02]